MSENILRVLLVEDDDDHAEIVARGLANSRVRSLIHRVSDGEAALDYVFRKARYADPCLSPRPSLVLLDLRLPGIDGLEVLRTIKEAPELRSLPVVMLTTSAAEPDIAAAYRGHANSYLVKPAEFRHINEMTQALSSYWLEWNRNPEPRDNLSRKRTEGGML